MGIGIYGLELRRSMQETQSDIYYRFNFCDETILGSALIAGKIIVQVDIERDA